MLRIRIRSFRGEWVNPNHGSDMETYQNLLIYYFSGTGNAKRVAQWMLQVAKERGLNTQLINIDRFEQVIIPKLAGKTLLGFCSPTHGFNLPPIMLEFINKFPKKTVDADVFILNTRAGMKLSKIFLPGLSGVAQYLPAIILRLKGYKIVGMQPMDMPSNWISLHPGLRSVVVESIHERCKEKSINAMNKMLDGRKIRKAFLSLPFDLAIAPICLGYYFVGRFMLAKTFVATSACTSCGLCMKQCPVNAIKLVDNRMYWRYNCESCMRCMNHCPARAIETAHGLTALSSWIAVSLFGIILAYVLNVKHLDIAADSWIAAVIYWIVGPIFCIFVFALIYRLFHFLMRYKFFDWLITYTSLTKFGFWRRYKVKKIKG